MMGKLQWLASGVLLAAAMMLAGCLAPVGDSEAEVDESVAAIEAVDDGDDPVIDREDALAEANPVLSSVGGGDESADPEPNPWVPTAGAALPGGPHDPGPSPMESKH